MRINEKYIGPKLWNLLTFWAMLSNCAHCIAAPSYSCELWLGSGDSKGSSRLFAAQYSHCNEDKWTIYRAKNMKFTHYAFNHASCVAAPSYSHEFWLCSGDLKGSSRLFVAQYSWSHAFLSALYSSCWLAVWSRDRMWMGICTHFQGVTVRSGDGMWLGICTCF